MYKNKTKSTSTQKFQTDLEYGSHFEWESIKFIEEYFNKFLKKKNLRLEFLQENFSASVKELKKWDMKYLLLDDFTGARIKTLTFEIKTDKFAQTGNLFFEKHCRKQASGVFATEADYFIYILPRYQEKNFYIAKPAQLVELLTTTFSQCISVGGGDGGRVTSYLINKQTFDEEFTKIGKLLYWDVEIPAKFNLDRFGATNKYTYYSNTNTKYENPLD